MAIAKVCFTYVVKKITYRDNTLEKHCPYHMKETTKKKNMMQRTNIVHLTILSLLCPYQKTTTQMMLLLMQEMKLIRVLQSFLFSTIRNVI